MQAQQRLLIVEDEITTWLALKMQASTIGPELVMDRFGGRSDEFNSWLADRAPANVAIIDLQLPSDTGINPDGGFDVLESMKTRQPEVRIIVLTSRNDRQAFERAASLSGVRHYFTKPWNKKELSAAIKECLTPLAARPGIVLHGALE